MSFVAQVFVPIFLYLVLYLQGSLHDVNSLFLGIHFVTIVVLYAIFGYHVFKGINRHRMQVQNFTEEHAVSEGAVGKSNTE